MKNLIPLFLILFFLSGCFKTEAPKCSDQEIQESVKEVYGNINNNIQNSDNTFLSGFSQVLPHKILSLESFRAIAYDKEIKLRSCKAQATFDTNQTLELNYTVQLSEEDSNEYYVELDTVFLETLIQQNLMREVFKRTTIK